MLAIVFSYRFGIRLLRIAEFLVLSALMRAEDFGAYCLVLGAIEIMSIMKSVGITEAVISSQSRRTAELLHSGLLMMSVPLLLCYLLGVQVYTSLSQHSNLYGGLVSASIAIPLLAIGIVPEALLKMESRFALHARILWLAELSSLTIVLLSVIADGGIGYRSAVLRLLVGTTITTAGVILALRSRLRWHWNFRELMMVLRTNRLFPVLYCTNYLYANTDIFLIGNVFGLKAVGGYRLARRCCQLLVEIINLTLTDFRLSSLCKAIGEKDRFEAEVQYQFKLTFFSVAAACGVGLVLMSIVSHFSIPPLWREAITLVPIFLLATFIGGLNPGKELFVALGEFSRYLRIVIIRWGALVVLLLCAHMNLGAIVWARVGSQLIFVILVHAIVAQLLQISLMGTLLSMNRQRIAKLLTSIVPPFVKSST